MKLIKVSIGKGIIMPDMFDWFEDHKLEHNTDWFWNRPSEGETLYRFYIRDEKMAMLFALRWL